MVILTKKTFSKHKTLLLSFIFFFIFSGAVSIFAAGPYAPGAILNPDCLPTDGTCKVNVLAIGNTVTDATAGSLLFAGASGVLAQDNTNLFWDNTANTNYLKLGSGTSPGQIQFLEGSGGGTNYVAFKAPSTLAGDVTWTLPNADGTSGQVLSTNGIGTLSWGTASVSLTGFTTPGNIGLGLTAGDSITSGLQNTVIGVNAGTAIVSGTGNTILGSNAGLVATSSNNILIGYQAGNEITSGSNNIILGYDIDAPSNTGSNQLSIGNMIFGTSIDGTGTTVSNGKIGIGTASPSATLDIKGQASSYTIGTTTFSGAGLNDITFGGTPSAGFHTYKVAIIGTGSPDTFAVQKDDNAVPFLGLTLITNGPIDIGDGITVTFGATTGHTLSTSWDNNSWSMTVSNTNPEPFSVQTSTGTKFLTGTANGFVGIGTENPAYKLEVSTDIASSYAAKFFNDGNATNRYGLLVQAGTDSASTGTLIQFNDGDGTDTGEITFSGTSTIYSTSSDRRMKDNIVDTHFSLSDLMKIKVQDYIFKDENTGRIYTGFIAQDLYEIYPDAVFAPEDENTMWGVDYGKITPLIVKAIQEMDLKLTGVQYFTDQTFISQLIMWFGDIGNGIGNLFANVFNAKEKICVDGECLTKNDIKVLLDYVHSQIPIVSLSPEPENNDNNGSGEIIETSSVDDPSDNIEPLTNEPIVGDLPPQEEPVSEVVPDQNIDPDPEPAPDPIPEVVTE